MTLIFRSKKLLIAKFILSIVSLNLKDSHVGYIWSSVLKLEG